MRVALIILSVLLMLPARAVDVRFTFEDGMGRPQSVRQFRLRPGAPPWNVSGKTVTGDTMSRTLNTSGYLVVSNLFGGPYQLELTGVSGIVTTNFYTFPTNSTSLVRAEDYATTATNFPSGLYAPTHSEVTNISTLVSSNLAIRITSTNIAPGVVTNNSTNVVLGGRFTGSGSNLTAIPGPLMATEFSSLQSAINASIAQGQREIYLPTVSYITNTLVISNAYGLRIRGGNNINAAIYSYVTNAPMVKFVGAIDCQIEGVHFIERAPKTTASVMLAGQFSPLGATLFSVQRNTFSHCKFNSQLTGETDIGVQINEDGTDAMGSENVFKECDFVNWRVAGLKLVGYNAHNNLLIGCQMTDCTNYGVWGNGGDFDWVGGAMQNRAWNKWDFFCDNGAGSSSISYLRSESLHLAKGGNQWLQIHKVENTPSVGAWAVKSYAVGDLVFPTSDTNGTIYRCTTAGASLVEPVWPVGSGSVTNGSVVWEIMNDNIIEFGRGGSLKGSIIRYGRVDGGYTTTIDGTMFTRQDWRWPYTLAAGHGNYWWMQNGIQQIWDVRTEPTFARSYTNSAVSGGWGVDMNNIMYAPELRLLGLTNAFLAVDADGKVVTTNVTVGGMVANSSGNATNLSAWDVFEYHGNSSTYPSFRIFGPGANKSSILLQSEQNGESSIRLGMNGGTDWTVGQNAGSQNFTIAGPGNLIMSADTNGPVYIGWAGYAGANGTLAISNAAAQVRGSLSVTGRVDIGQSLWVAGQELTPGTNSGVTAATATNIAANQAMIATNALMPVITNVAANQAQLATNAVMTAISNGVLTFGSLTNLLGGAGIGATGQLHGTGLRLTGPAQLASYTVAQLPAGQAGWEAWCSDMITPWGIGGKAVHDGVNWVTTPGIIATEFTNRFIVNSSYSGIKLNSHRCYINCVVNSLAEWTTSNSGGGSISSTAENTIYMSTGTGANAGYFAYGTSHYSTPKSLFGVAVRCWVTPSSATTSCIADVGLTTTSDTNNVANQARFLYDPDQRQSQWVTVPPTLNTNNWIIAFSRGTTATNWWDSGLPVTSTNHLCVTSDGNMITWWGNGVVLYATNYNAYHTYAGIRLLRARGTTEHRISIQSASVVGYRGTSLPTP